MADVGVRELKARLSEFLERAARGETIRVTDRGRPKAMLVPLTVEQRIAEGVAAGWIRPPEGKPVVWRRRFRPLRPSEEILTEDRGE
jgi:prevent-host-death family protein